MLPLLLVQSALSADAAFASLCGRGEAARHTRSFFSPAATAPCRTAPGPPGKAREQPEQCHLQPRATHLALTPPSPAPISPRLPRFAPHSCHSPRQRHPRVTLSPHAAALQRPEHQQFGTNLHEVEDVDRPRAHRQPLNAHRRAGGGMGLGA